MLRLAAVLAVATVLPACTSSSHFGRGTPSSVSIDAAQVSSPVAEIIAEDLVATLADVIGPGTTTMALATDGSAFAAVLESTLRNRGYAVAIDATESENDTSLTYTLGSFKGTVLARLSTPHIAVARAYALSNNTAEPSSSLSILRLD